MVCDSVRRAPGEEKAEFLSSTDQWFRPTNLSTGPDGAIYIVDMYREIIEDYSAIPRYLQQQFGLVEGSDRGRIWRIVPKHNRPVRGKTKPDDATSLARAKSDRLIALLSHANSWQRETAQRMLVERGDKSIGEPLAALLHKGQTPQARLHALYTLDGLQLLNAEMVQGAIDDSHFAVRLHALRLCRPWLDERPSLLQEAIKRVDDPDARVRLQLALTLGDSQDRLALQSLVKLAAKMEATIGCKRPFSVPPVHRPINCSA